MPAPSGASRWTTGRSKGRQPHPGGAAAGRRPFGVLRPRGSFSVCSITPSCRVSAGSPWSLATPSNFTPRGIHSRVGTGGLHGKERSMTRVALALVALLAGAGPALGQSSTAPTSAVATSKMLWEQLSGWFTTAAAETPESLYAFRPTSEVRSFGQLVGHVAGAQYLICGAAMGEQPKKETRHREDQDRQGRPGRRAQGVQRVLRQGLRPDRQGCAGPDQALRRDPDPPLCPHAECHPRRRALRQYGGLPAAQRDRAALEPAAVAGRAPRWPPWAGTPSWPHCPWTPGPDAGPSRRRLASTRRPPPPSRAGRRWCSISPRPTDSGWSRSCSTREAGPSARPTT